MKRIVVKSGVAQLPLFVRENYSYYEAYLRGDEKLADLLKTKMKLLSIHMPSQVDTANGKKQLDFCADNEIGEASLKKLSEIVDFAEENNVFYIVIHLGFFNSLQENRFRKLEKAAKKFNQFAARKVTLCLENVPCWTNICFENEPIISTEEHFLFFKKHCPNIGSVFDVDHLAINTVFNHFYEDFGKKYPAVVNKELYRKEMEQVIEQKTNENKLFFQDLVHKKIQQFLTAIQPDIVHAVGSDFCHYRMMGSLPLVGEALPLHYQGQIKGYPVEDKLDHSLWMSLLPQKVLITLELMLRDDYDYLKMIKKDYEYVSSLINLDKNKE